MQSLETIESKGLPAFASIDMKPGILMALPRPNSFLDALRPYQAAGGFDPIYNLSANESCLGASPAAIDVAMRAVRTMERYPDGGCTRLRQAIAARHALLPDQIICSAGSEELISMIVQAFAGSGDEVLFNQFGFIKYELAARAFGALPVRAEDRNFTADVATLLEAVTPATRIVFLANPNNPTGTYIPKSELRRLRTGLRDDILLVIDAAYAEYVALPDYEDGLDLAQKTRNTLVLRTFSKIYGLAGLRVGWGYGAVALIAALHKVRGAFNVGSVGQAAAAAAIQDHAHERAARDHNDRWRPWLARQLADLGLQVTPSAGNFLMTRFPDATTCQLAVKSLERQGVLTMPLSGYGIPEALRITVGLDRANEAVVRGLKDMRI